MYIWINDTAPPASNSVYARDVTKYIYQNMCVTVVQWSTSCLHVQINRLRIPVPLFSVSLYRFFCLVVVSWSYFSFWPVFLYSYCWPCWSCMWINIYVKLIFRVLYWKRDLKSSWSAYWLGLRPEKTMSCQDMYLLWNSWMLVDIMTNNTQDTTNCTNLHQHPLAKVKLAFCTSS